MKNRLAVFIHGLGSTHEKTWAKMLRLCSEDKILSSEYDFDYFEYHTSKWADFCREGIPKLALMLDSKVNADWQSYESIFFVAHSMGGIVAKQYILDLDTFSKGSNVKGIFFFATPSNGSTLAKIGRASCRERVFRAV